MQLVNIFFAYNRDNLGEIWVVQIIDRWARCRYIFSDTLFADIEIFGTRG